MRSLTWSAAFACLTLASVAAQAPPLRSDPPTARVGTMSELMVHMIYPTSDAVFYISSRTPTSDAEWTELQAKTLTLAESANLLMMPGRARDQDRWMKDAKLMLDAGWAAFKAAKAKDVAALEALSDQLYESCVTCHKNYRPDYGKKPGEIAKLRN
jgi:cytochrome c556